MQCSSDSVLQLEVDQNLAEESDKESRSLGSEALEQVARSRTEWSPFIQIFFC